MNSQENELRRALNKRGYILGKRDSGYRIGDKVTETVYLGGEFDATLDDVIKFADNIDESGYSDLAPFTDGHEKFREDSYAINLDMEIANLERHRETLILQGKHTQAEELAVKIKELEVDLADEDEMIDMEKMTRSFLDEHGYIMEQGIDGYRISEKATGAVCLGKRYDADIEDAAEFAEKLGMKIEARLT